MTAPTDNKRRVDELTAALVLADPTPAELRHAMKLAYEAGRIDGAREVCENMLKERAA